MKPPIENRTQAGEKPVFADYVVTIAHDKQYAGYVITAKRKNPNPPVAILPDATFTIKVETSEFKATFAGGFAITGLHDDGLALVPVDKSSPQSYTIVSDERNKEWGRRSVATFVHLWHSTYPSWALAFGLGLDNGSGQDYFYGGSWRLGDQGALTLGGVFGSVKGTPAGKAIGSTTTEANALSSRVSRMRGSWFVALSFPFLGNGSTELGKPFKGATESSAGVGTPSAGSTNASAANVVGAINPEPATQDADRKTAAGTSTDLVVKVTDVRTGNPLAKGTKVYWWTEKGKVTGLPDAGESDTNDAGVSKVSVAVPTVADFPAEVAASLRPRTVEKNAKARTKFTLNHQ